MARVSEARKPTHSYLQQRIRCILSPQQRRHVLPLSQGPSPNPGCGPADRSLYYTCPSPTPGPAPAPDSLPLPLPLLLQAGDLALAPGGHTCYGAGRGAAGRPRAAAPAVPGRAGHGRAAVRLLLCAVRQYGRHIGGWSTYGHERLGLQAVRLHAAQVAGCHGPARRSWAAENVQPRGLDQHLLPSV